MLIEIINEKKYSAERVFFCNWMELCGYLVIGRDNVLDRPANYAFLQIDGKEYKGLLIGHAYNRIILEITQDLLDRNDERSLQRILFSIMRFIDKIERDEEILYDDYKDDRSDVIEEISNLYVMEKIYLHCFILNRTYGTTDLFTPSIRKINKCMQMIQRWNSAENDFLNFVILYLYSKTRKAQTFLNLISRNESLGSIDKCNDLLERMKMSHYQDALYLAKSHIYETMSRGYDKVWKNLTHIKSEHYYVLYKLGYLKEKYWKQDTQAKELYVRSKINMPDYFRADYKLAYFYEIENNFISAKRSYTQVIRKIWHIPDTSPEYFINIKNPHLAQYFTLLDIDYLIKTWDRLLTVLVRWWLEEENNKRQQDKIHEEIYIYYRLARENYEYIKMGIENSIFLKKLFYHDRDRHKMFDIILDRIREGKTQLQELYEHSMRITKNPSYDTLWS